MLQYTQITNLIGELLYSHDCVIIPNFGGFVARNNSALFSKGNNVLSPPSKHILFNKNLVHNDGLLVSALMEKNNVLFAEASEQIGNYKDYIQSLLLAKKRFELTNIGLLYIDSENIMRFEAKADVNFLLESFGFEPVVANQLVFDTEKPLVTKPFEDRKVTVEVQPKTKKSYLKVAMVAVVAPVTVALLLFAANSKPMQPIMHSSLNPFYSPEKKYSPNKQAADKPVFIETIEKQPLLSDANGYAAFKLAENGNVFIASEHEVISKIAAKPITKKNTLVVSENSRYDGAFQVVVGCFGVEANADKLIKELADRNITAAISGKNAKGLHVVSCGGFNSKDSATSLLNSIKAKLPHAWVMMK